MKDTFDSSVTSLTSPATAAETITPSDSEMLNFATRGIFVGEGGNIAVRMLSGDVITLNNAPSGIVYALRITQVLETGTTATGLVGLR